MNKTDLNLTPISRDNNIGESTQAATTGGNASPRVISNSCELSPIQITLRAISLPETPFEISSIMLPKEILMHILKLLQSTDIRGFRSTCKALHASRVFNHMMNFSEIINFNIQDRKEPLISEKIIDQVNNAYYFLQNKINAAISISIQNKEDLREIQLRQLGNCGHFLNHELAGLLNCEQQGLAFTTKNLITHLELKGYDPALTPDNILRKFFSLELFPSLTSLTIEHLSPNFSSTFPESSQLEAICIKELKCRHFAFKNMLKLRSLIINRSTEGITAVARERGSDLTNKDWLLTVSSGLNSLEKVMLGSSNNTENWTLVKFEKCSFKSLTKLHIGDDFKLIEPLDPQYFPELKELICSEENEPMVENLRQAMKDGTLGKTYLSNEQDPADDILSAQDDTPTKDIRTHTLTSKSKEMPLTKEFMAWVLIIFLILAKFSN